MSKKTKSDTGLPQEVADLVSKFEEHAETYQSGTYNETQLRRDFLDPFFEALGWDVNNRQGYAEAYRDVIHEDSLRVEKSVKAPDYGFRIGGVRKFFVEAKKPSVDIKLEAAPAFQLRRYAWTAKLPLSILTDFEEFAVYDCRIKPDKKDSASKARILYFKYTEYAEKWDEIAGIFSLDAILKGSFDKYAESTKKKSGTAEVDDAFLAEIEHWREILARNIALRNPQITDRELNFSVTRIIDRIIFLRMCEGRGIERYARLRDTTNGKNCYRRLVELFQQADTKYNSGLFHFQSEKGREPPDELTTSLALDDKVLKDILGRLYYPDSPYEFAALPADILGQVYEQFLGKVIRLTKGHQAKVEEKPEVRKAGGVYYTPTYIVDYIVENTVGKLLEGKSPQQVGGLTKTWRPSKTARPLAVLDPACGSGSFLIVAYQYLLDWYLEQYTEKDAPANHARGKAPRVYQTRDSEWHLTTDERKRILLTHIYGVDIDFQAVEVTKLSLLLKVLEGETEQSIERTLFAKQRALPDLADNIKCGNSLVGTDFYHEKQPASIGSEEQWKINAFDWNDEFSGIFAGNTPGFDAVIGNPPYGANFEDFVLPYIRQKYSTLTNSLDSYIMFMHQSVALLSEGGRFGMIVPSGWVSLSSASRLRQVFLDAFTPESFVSLPYDVFKGAYIDTVVTTARRKSTVDRRAKRPACDIDLVVCPLRFKLYNMDDFKPFKKVGNFRDWTAEKGFLILSSSSELKLIERLHATGTVLNDHVEVMRGVESFHPAGKAGMHRPMLAHTGALLRYELTMGEQLFFDYEPSVEASKPYRFFSGPRILLRQLISRRFRLQASYIDSELITNQSIQSLVPREDTTPLLVILAVINSRLLSWYFCQTNTVARRDDFPKTIIKTTRALPMPAPLAIGTELPTRQSLESKVSTLLDLYSGMTSARTEHERTTLQRQITATERQIDQLVYKLYGLTDDEIGIVVEATN